MRNTKTTTSFKIRTLIFGLFYIILIIGCANPVPPLGGEKDTTKPTILSILNTPKKTRQIIEISFNENVQTKNTLITSPITNNSNTTTVTKNKKITIITDQHTNTIYLNQFVTDLNENNPINQPVLILNQDSGEILIQTPIEDIKRKKHLFVRDINRYTYPNQPLFNDRIYIPTTQDNQTYHFYGLTDSLHLLYVIYDDLDYSINDDELANCILIKNNLKDTLSVNCLTKKRKYKGAFNYRDSLYLITEPIIDKNWFDEDLVHIYYNDSLFITKQNIAIISKKLDIDSFIDIGKIEYPKICNRYYFTKNKTLDTIEVLSPVQYFNTGLTPSRIRKKSNTGLLSILNPNPFTIYSTIYIGNSRILIQLKPKSKDSIYLPEGNYKFLCWIQNPQSKDELQPSFINYTQQTPLNESDLIYKPKNGVSLSNKLDNTLILPSITAFNSGITYK